MNALISYGLRTGQITLPAPKPPYIPVHSRRQGNRPLLKHCKSAHICIKCRTNQAINYGLDGFGTHCVECMEARRARQRLRYAKMKGEGSCA